MKLSKIYQILSWPLRFWRTTTLPKKPPAHIIPFGSAVANIISLQSEVASLTPSADELMRDLKSHSESTAGEQKQCMTDQEFKEKCAAMDVRYSSLKQGETLGKLSSEELRELRGMETGCGWCLNLNDHRPPERLGMRSAWFPE